MPKRKIEDEEEEILINDPHNRAIIERKRNKLREKRNEETVDDVLKKCNSFDLVWFNIL